MLSKYFQLKGDELLIKLGLKTKKVICNKDIQEAKNFSAIINKKER